MKKIQNSLPFYKFYRRLANSNTTKEALNCTASIAADSIVDVNSFISSVTQKQISAATARFEFLNPARSDSGQI